MASVQAFWQCGEDVVYNEIDVAALRAEVLAAEAEAEARRQALIDQGRQKEEAACVDDTSGAVLSSRKGEPCAGASSVAATGTSSSVVLGLVLGLGLGVPLCLLCVGMLIFCGRRRKREAPAAPHPNRIAACGRGGRSWSRQYRSRLLRASRSDDGRSGDKPVVATAIQSRPLCVFLGEWWLSTNLGEW